MEFIKRLFGEKEQTQDIPDSWHEVQSKPNKDLLSEPLGPHIVREVLDTGNHRRLLLADCNGAPNQAVYIQHYPLLTEASKEDEELPNRVKVDLETANRIRHKFLYPIKGYSTEQDFYLVFSVVPNLTLQQHMEQNVLTPSEAVACIVGLLDLINTIHKNGLKVGDLKPSEIWLTASKEPRLLTGQWVLEHESVRQSERMTAAASYPNTGGNVDYLAPEVLRGEGIQFATDQYILGAILFRLLTGKSVAGEDTQIMLRLSKIVRQPPPLPSKLQPSLGTAFDEVLPRMLAKDPKKRYENCAQVIPELRQALAQIGR